MRYITGIHALNLECSLDTCGDWHTSALRWVDITWGDTDDSIFGVWGIEYTKKIPEHTGKYAVANHIRALLDLIVDGNFAVAQGMREDFICNEIYTDMVLDKVMELKEHKKWSEIDKFILREYKLDWIKYKEGR